MPDITHTKIEEIDAIEGVLEGIKLHRAAAGLGVSSFGISIIDLAPGADQYPEHDHAPEGIGGQMFAKRPQQLDQEEVYVALRGSGTLEADGERYPLDPDHIVRRSGPSPCHPDPRHRPPGHGGGTPAGPLGTGHPGRQLERPGH